MMPLKLLGQKKGKRKLSNKEFVVISTGLFSKESYKLDYDVLYMYKRKPFHLLIDNNTMYI